MKASKNTNGLKNVADIMQKLCGSQVAEIYYNTSNDTIRCKTFPQYNGWAENEDSDVITAFFCEPMTEKEIIDAINWHIDWEQ